MATDPEIIVATLARLGIALQRPQDPKVLVVYADLIAPRVDEALWVESVGQWAASAEWAYFPSVPMLLSAYQARVDAAEGRRPVEVEAVDAYTRVLDCGVYTPETGTRWTYRGVVESCGKAAAEAWLAAGGHEAFATTWRADERRHAFVTKYLEEAREQPETRLLPWKPAAELTAGTPEPALPREQAAELLKRLAPEHAAETTPAPRNKPRWVEASPERLARLREQAAALLAAETETDVNAPSGAGRA